MAVSKAALRGMRRVQAKKRAKDGWTAAKRALFIETLKTTCNIAASLRKVRMSRSGLDKLCARNGGFRAEMAEARRQAYRDLEYFALEKLMAGTVKTVTKADGKVETVHEYPLHLALQLLRLHRDAAPDGGAAGVADEADAEPSEEQRMEVVERLMRKLGKLRERMRREEEAAAAAGGAESGVLAIGAGEGGPL
jgi:hypothetical protein